MADDREKSKAIGEAVQSLMQKIREIDPKIALELKRGGKGPPGPFSDWNDHFKDGGTFWDSFGKAGG